MTNINLTIRAWHDYELIDSGDNRKLERYGTVTLIRPETQAIWKPARPEDWKKADAEFTRSGEKGSWRTKKGLPESWEMIWNDVHCAVRLTSFKHTGIFPEQAANWEWAGERVMELKKTVENPKVLNLFGYTGLASIALAKRGAHVTHVDASKQSNTWAKENATLSETPAENIRYILDDALGFVLREVRRGTSYEGIILDPPAFGRGAKGEVWRIEEHLPRLLEALSKIFARTHGSFFLLNGYAAGYSAQSFLQALESYFPEMTSKPKTEFGELRIQESNSHRVVPQGIYARFVR
jgi:23S rRNA (cytosine1962-C5)-methyltransferase